MGHMEGKQQVRLGAVQETLFIPLAARASSPPGYRYLMPLADPLLGRAIAITLFRASSPAAAG